MLLFRRNKDAYSSDISRLSSRHNSLSAYRTRSSSHVALSQRLLNFLLYVVIKRARRMRVSC